MVVHTDILTYFFLVFCGLYNGFLFLSFLWFSLDLPLLKSRDNSGSSKSNSEPPIITLILPLLNEEKVIENSITHLLGMASEGLEVLAVDDYSTDSTPIILSNLSKKEPRLYYLHRDKLRSQLGKGDVLNHAYDYLRYEKFPHRNPNNWVIGVFDADGRPVEADFFSKVHELFADENVAAAQCGVRIRNSSRLIPALQDVEFATFSFITQTVRDRTSGAVALGGNGQFIRASTLDKVRVEGEYWDTTALTEDLEIGTRILLSGGRIKFINRWVSQEGVEMGRALIRQRVRWAWGSLQVFTNYVLSGRILRASIPIRRKIDLHYYLSFWIVPFVVILTLVLFLFDKANLLTIANGFGWRFLIINSFSFIPLVLTGLFWAKVKWWKIAYLAPISILYTYHWIPVLLIAWVKIISGVEPFWMKTERYELRNPGKSFGGISRVKLGEILVDLGVCGPDLIQEALEQQIAGQGLELLGDVLTNYFAVDVDELERALEIQRSIVGWGLTTEVGVVKPLRSAK